MVIMYGSGGAKMNSQPCLKGANSLEEDMSLQIEFHCSVQEGVCLGQRGDTEEEMMSSVWCEEGGRQ